MASANGSGRLTPAQLELEERKRAKKAKRLARKAAQVKKPDSASVVISIDA